MKQIATSSKFLALVVLTIALAVFAVGCGGNNGFNVSDVQHDPFAFPGEITVTGTVAAFSQADPNLFGIMDTDELMQCGRFDCGAWIMPVMYTGAQLPQITQGDNVTLTGEFTSGSDGVTFQVTSMNVGNNVMNRLPQ